LKAVYQFQALITDTRHAFNSGFDTVNVHRPTKSPRVPSNLKVQLRDGNGGMRPPGNVMGSMVKVVSQDDDNILLNEVIIITIITIIIVIIIIIIIIIISRGQYKTQERGGR
jgi:hypothetical protein